MTVATGLDIRLHAGERGILVGKSRIGKSTLGTHIVREFMREYPAGHVLVMDTKPRYRAIFHPNGMRVKYKDWVQGDTFSESVAISDEEISLKQAFLHGRVVILQTYTSKIEPVRDYRRRSADYAEQIFRFAGERHPCLLYVDELYDIVTGLSGVADSELLHTIRSGGERNLAVLVGSQRPKSIPIPTMSEAINFYIFSLDYEEDVKHLRKFGPPLAHDPKGHEFVFNRTLPGGKRIEELACLRV